MKGPELTGPLAPVIRPFQRFFDAETSGGVLLLGSSLLAVAWANSAWSSSYFALWDTHLSIGIGDYALSKTLSHWINDGLMAVFFFVVGLEIKRELLVGELRSLKRATLPIAGAIGGMAAPALIYLAFNHGTPTVHGWGVPTATDIAFVVGALALLGKRAPLGLRVFLTALAIVDDMGAVVIIALFYTTDLSTGALGVGLGVLALMALANVLQVRHPLVYAILGAIMWFAFLKSGVHATVAGVLGAATIPARVRIDHSAFVRLGRGLIERFNAAGDGKHIITDGERQGAVSELESICEGVQTPLQRLEHSLMPWVTRLIIPVFALANAGVAIKGGVVSALADPVAHGVALGLALGKPLGITLVAWLAVRAGVAALPAGVTWRHIHGAGWLGGIGFTMSLFIAHLAFGEGDELNVAKMAVLAGSIVAAIVGFGILRTTAPVIEPEPRLS